MGWKDDNFGKVFRSNEIKLYYPGHTWAMKLSQLKRQQGKVRIITYTLDLNYVRKQFDRRPSGIWILCHSKCRVAARELKKAYPACHVAVRDDVHAKVLLIEPDTVYVTSANFGDSGWREADIGVRSKEAHDAYVTHAFDRLLVHRGGTLLNELYLEGNGQRLTAIRLHARSA